MGQKPALGKKQVALVSQITGAVYGTETGLGKETSGSG